ncbi:MAG: alpha/beta hydrolase family protein [Bacteroidales bacterium]
MKFRRTKFKALIPWVGLILLSGWMKAQNYPIGNQQFTWIDPDRNNRSIPVAIYYPAVSTGTGTPVAQGVFPVVSFGHGFVMVHTAYKYLWEALVPKGYIVAFPLSESSAIPAPNHENFGLDIAFVARTLVQESQNPASLFYGHVKNKTALMGHSMGGGSAFLGTAADTSVTTLVTLAAANTNPSAVQAAANVFIPTLLFAGQNDCVTPPSQHQQPMYENTASGQKAMITILGGGHCYFADYNFNCSLGELTCSPQPTITRSEQQDITIDFLLPWLDFTLNDNNTAWQIFYDSLLNSKRISYQMVWPLTGHDKTRSLQGLRVPARIITDPLELTLPEGLCPFSLEIYSMNGQRMLVEHDTCQTVFKIPVASWPKGWYIIRIIGKSYLCAGKVFRK